MTSDDEIYLHFVGALLAPGRWRSKSERLAHREGQNGHGVSDARPSGGGPMHRTCTPRGLFFASMRGASATHMCQCTVLQAGLDRLDIMQALHIDYLDVRRYADVCVKLLVSIVLAANTSAFLEDTASS